MDQRMSWQLLTALLHWDAEVTMNGTKTVGYSKQLDRTQRLIYSGCHTVKDHDGPKIEPGDTADWSLQESNPKTLDSLFASQKLSNM